MIGYKLFLGLIIAIAAGWGFYNRCRDESDLTIGNYRLGRKTALVDPLLLPVGLVALLAISLLRNGLASTGEVMTRLCTVLFLYISLYFALLLCLLPLLRRLISARACATLWLMPNLLYMGIYYVANIELNPLLVITFPRRRLTLFAWIWLAGFVCVLLWQVISHLRFRSSLLQDAIPVTDEGTLSQWAYEQKRGEVKHPFPLLTSADINTPVSIGLFDRTLRLVLPVRRYTERELTLIFRHELRHIQRLDIRTKAFVGFCAAMCWFNPLMWIAQRKALDDLELSCDEAVLAGADEDTRQLYAELLLNAAGSSKGYTTCLSAAANSLRYRLKNIVRPRKRYAGVVAIGIAMLALVMVYGTVALADSGGTVQTLILESVPSDNVIDRVVINNWPEQSAGYISVYGWDEDALTAYLASLHVKRVYVGSYSDEELRQIYVDYATPEEGSDGRLTRFELCDGLLWANIPYDDYGDLIYVLEDEVDWDYLESLLDRDAPDPDPAPHPPEMMMYFGDEISHDGRLMHASKTVLSIRSSGEEKPVTENLNDGGAGGVHGFPVSEVQLTFSYEPVKGYEVQVEDWDRTKSYFVSSDDLSEGILPLAPYSAHYTVYGTFATVRETVYEMKYTFDVELPDE